MARQSKYAPDTKLVQSLASPIVKADVKTPEVIDKDQFVPSAQDGGDIVLSSENTEIAINHIKDTLDTLKKLLDDLKELAPASQQGFFFQTASVIAKTRLDGANMLASLQDPSKKPKEEKRGGTRSNHLHLRSEENV